MALIMFNKHCLLSWKFCAPHWSNNKSKSCIIVIFGVFYQLEMFKSLINEIQIIRPQKFDLCTNEMKSLNETSWLTTMLTVKWQNEQKAAPIVVYIVDPNSANVLETHFSGYIKGIKYNWNFVNGREKQHFAATILIKNTKIGDELVLHELQ